MMEKTKIQFEMIDSKSGYSFMFGDVAFEVALDMEYRIG